MNLGDFFKYGGIDIFNGGCMSLFFSSVGITASSTVANPSTGLPSLISATTGVSVLGSVGMSMNSIDTI